MKWLQRIFSNNSADAQLRESCLALHDHLATLTLELTGSGQLAMPDDFTARFEVMVLSVSYCLVHWQKGNSADRERSAWLWEMLFEGFDHSLRERGVNDIRIGSRVRKLQRHASGRRNAYATALEAGDQDQLRQALARNVLNNCAGDDPRLDILAAFLENQILPLAQAQRQA